jgi:hypothetical protein
MSWNVILLITTVVIAVTALVIGVVAFTKTTDVNELPIGVGLIVDSTGKLSTGARDLAHFSYPIQKSHLTHGPGMLIGSFGGIASDPDHDSPLIYSQSDGASLVTSTVLTADGNVIYASGLSMYIYTPAQGAAEQYIRTSTDGIVWGDPIPQPGFGNDFTTLRHDPVTGLVYFHNGSRWGYSINGTKFYQIKPIDGIHGHVTREAVRQIVSNSEISVSAGSQGFMWSLDGITWVKTPDSFDCNTVAWNEQEEYFFGYGENASINVMFTSVDGKVWATEPTRLMNGFKSLAHLPSLGKYVVTGEYSCAYLTTDGRKFEKLDLNLPRGDYFEQVSFLEEYTTYDNVKKLLYFVRQWSGVNYITLCENLL